MDMILYSGKTKSSSQGTTRSLVSLLLLTGTAFFYNAQAQMDKRLALAEKQYAAGNYYTAAGLYGQFLKPMERSKSASAFPLNTNRNATGLSGHFKNSTAILFKQAESYRLAHYWKEAASLYMECFEIDPGNYASALYWYAVCNRSLGNYTIADKSIRQFLEKPVQALQPSAEKELETLAFIRSQLHQA
jgi:tetratricopeptide (TPR) repeat protein